MNAIEPSSAKKHASLVARYGAERLPEAGPWNAVIESLLQHRSVRGYKSDAVPAGTLETMVAAAQSAATSSNLQTWSVVVVENPETRAKLAQIAGNQKHIVECPLFVVWLADVSRNERLAAVEGKSLEAVPYLETFLVAAIDAALAAQNAVTAVESMGLSTVYIGALRNDPEAVARLLDLPAGAVGVFGLCVGYAKPEALGEVKPRLPQGVVLHRERYKHDHEQAERTAYDERLGKFSKAHEMAQYTWTERVFSRQATIKALNGRDRLKGILAALGFPLK